MLPVTLSERTRWQDPFDWLNREMQRVLGSNVVPWMSTNGGEDCTGAYPVDIHEDDKSIHVEAELPGFKKDEVQITLENGILSIVAERKTAETGKDKKHLTERVFARVERRFTLPTAVEESKVDAHLKDGVLHLTLQKAKEAQPRRISVT